MKIKKRILSIILVMSILFTVGMVQAFANSSHVHDWIYTNNKTVEYNSRGEAGHVKVEYKLYKCSYSGCSAEKRIESDRYPQVEHEITIERISDYHSGRMHYTQNKYSCSRCDYSEIKFDPKPCYACVLPYSVHNSENEKCSEHDHLIEK